MFKYSTLIFTILFISSVVMAHDEAGHNEEGKIPAVVLITGTIVLFAAIGFLVRNGLKSKADS